MAPVPEKPRTLLEAWAREHNLGKRDLAEEILRISTRSGRHLALSERQIGRLWSGQVESRPHPITCRVLESLTGIPIADLLAPIDPSTTAIRAEVGRAELIVGHRGTPQQDDLIASATLESQAHALHVGSITVSEILLEKVGDQVIVAARTYYERPALGLFGELVSLRNQTYRLLELTRQPGQQADLYLFAGQINGLMSSLAFDLNRLDSAMDLARVGHLYADLARHNGLRSWTRIMQALTAYWSGRPSDAVQYATGATEMAPRGTGVAVRAHSVLARAYSHLGAVEEARRALASADAEREPGRSDLLDQIGGEFSYSGARQLQSRATALLTMGYGEEAVDAAERALNAKSLRGDPQWSTTRLYAMVDRAAGLLAMGDVTESQQAAEPIWEIPVDQRRRGVLVRLESMRQKIVESELRTLPAAQIVSREIEEFRREAVDSID